KPVETEKPAEENKQAITDEQLKTALTAIKGVIGADKSDADAIQWLQGKLSVSQTGVYDAATKSAVQTWQKDNGVEETGVIDADMASKL
ncbi:MAG: peptidoglycan-binding domain-containing protein, partial [Clostridia bacterium]|nr:peptidoglycan-binding domain-containing protein [Clostridia bacterium]